MTLKIILNKLTNMRSFIFLLAVVAFFLTACSDDDEQEPPRDRDRPADAAPPVVEVEIEGQVQVTSAPQAQETKPEGLIFPLDLTDHEELHIDPKDDKIQLTVTPKETPLRLIAGWSGSISLETKNSSHNLTLYSSQHNKKIHFILSEKDTTLKVSAGQSVQQGELLAETTHPILFSVSRDEHATNICLSVKNLSTKIKVFNNLPSSACPSS